MSEEYRGPYDGDVCHFKFKGCEKKPAGYSRRENGTSRGPYFDACENCARVEYPQPQQFQEEEKTS